MELFATHVHTVELKDTETLFDNIITHVKNERDTNPNENRHMYSLNGEDSYHSRDNLVNLDYEWSKMLRSLVYKISSDFAAYEGTPIPKYEDVDINCWCMVMGRGSFSMSHSHPGAEYSGVIWLQTPENMPGNQGNFVFQDPRMGARYSIHKPEGTAIPPIPSNGIVFWSWMEHFVQPHYCEGERISVSWNINF